MVRPLSFITRLFCRGLRYGTSDFPLQLARATRRFPLGQKNQLLSGVSRLSGSLLFSARSFIGGGHVCGRMEAPGGRGLVYLLVEDESDVSRSTDGSSL